MVAAQQDDDRMASHELRHHELCEQYRPYETHIIPSSPQQLHHHHTTNHPIPQQKAEAAAKKKVSGGNVGGVGDL